MYTIKRTVTHKSTNAQITRNAVNFTIGTGDSTISCRAYPDTLFFVETRDASDILSYKVYRGINSVPNIMSAGSVTVYIGMFASSGLDFATAVYIRDAKVVTPGIVTPAIMFVSTMYSSTASDSRGMYYIYSAVIDGMPGTIEAVKYIILADCFLGAVIKNDVGLVYECISLYGSDIGTLVGGTGTTAPLFGVVNLAGNHLAYTDGTQVFYVTPYGIVNDSNGVSSIVTDANDIVSYYTIAGVLAAVYITEVPGGR